MNRLLTVVPSNSPCPLCQFFKSLDEKQRQKLLSPIYVLLQAPQAIMREPYTKHFSLERYQSLYELRAKSKTLVRIIFTLTDEGDVLFLAPFIKRLKRDTMQSLDASLRLMAESRMARARHTSCPYNFFCYRSESNYEKQTDLSRRRG